MCLKNKIKSLLRIFAGFSMAGLIATLVSLLLLYIFIDTFGFPLLPTYISVYIITVGISFYINIRYVFKTGYHARYLVKYCAVYLSGMLVGMVILKVFQTYLLYEEWILSYMVIPITFAWNFLLCYKFLKKNSYER